MSSAAARPLPRPLDMPFLLLTVCAEDQCLLSCVPGGFPQKLHARLHHAIPHAQGAVMGDEARASGRTLVFAANVAAAGEVASCLEAAGLQPLLYHRDIPAADRAAALDTMRSRCRGPLHWGLCGHDLHKCKLRAACIFI